MTTIEYLSLSKGRRFFVSIGRFFSGMGKSIAHFFVNLPRNLWKLLKKCGAPFYVLYDALVRGDGFTRTNFFIFGFAQLFRRQIVKGILYLLYQIVFVLFFAFIGVPYLSQLPTLGMAGSAEISVRGIPLKIYNDNSFSILLYSLVTIFLLLIYIFLGYSSIRDAKSIQDSRNIGRLAENKSFVKSLSGSAYHYVLLSFPMAGLAIFTLIPIIFMVIIGFTNYDSYHLTPTSLFDWVGWQNYSNIFTGGQTGGTIFLTTFLQVVAWTLIWAFFATFSNYFLGMIVALLINTKGIKLKKFWRTVLVTTIAVPQFVSLLLISRMLNQDVGLINVWLEQLGWIQQGIKWLSDPWIAKVMIIVINTWIGIPYTMLICTGILMNIPNDLYESARIDGASPYKMYAKITLPYMLFVTGPYLLSAFIGNINNFNIIYLLSGGGPLWDFGTQTVPETLTGVGHTDLLITWIYKMTMTNVYKDYGTASVLGVMIFVVIAFFSLIFYNRSSAVKNEEQFQ